MNKLVEKLYKIQQSWWADSGVSSSMDGKDATRVLKYIEAKNGFAVQASSFHYCHFMMQSAFKDYFDGNIEIGDQKLVNAHLGVTAMLPLHINFLAGNPDELDCPEHAYDSCRLPPESFYFHMCLSYLLGEEEFKLYSSYALNELLRPLELQYTSLEADVGFFCTSLASLITNNTLANNPGWWEIENGDNKPYEGPYVELLKANSIGEIKDSIYQCLEYRLKSSTSKVYSYFEVGYNSLMPFELLAYIKYLKESKGIVVEIEHPLFKEEYISLKNRISDKTQADEVIKSAVAKVEETQT
jgi:hypothetical protein